MRKKILTTFLIVFFTVIIFNIDSVFGVGVVSQSWKTDVNGKPALIFRTYTTPHPTTVATYHSSSSSDLVDGGEWNYTYNGVSYKSKWVYRTENGIVLPTPYQFRVMGLAFHSKQIGKYVSEGKSNGSNVGYNLSNIKLSNNMATVRDAVNNSTAYYTKPEVQQYYDKTVFYESFASKGTITNLDWGTGLKVNNLNAVGKTEYRYAIVNIDGTNIYVGDNIVYYNDLTGLIEAAYNAYNNGILQSMEQCYVSSLVISETLHSSGGYELARNARDFFWQYSKNGLGSFWSDSTRGMTEKAMGSVVNLYDNILMFPQLSTRTVLVRHINLEGTNLNRTPFTRSLINKYLDNRLTITESVIKLIDPENIKDVNTLIGEIISLTKNINFKGYEELFTGIGMNQQIEKESSENNIQKCVGYNYGIGDSLLKAQSQVDNKINNGTYTKTTVSNTDNDDVVKISAKSITSNDDYIIIDFYYTEYEKNVHVNHLYVDADGYVQSMNKQDIVPNSYAYEGKTQINRINTDRSIKETYQQRRGHTITTRIADSLKSNEKVEYKGYEVFTNQVSAESLVGKRKTAEDLKTGKTVNITGNTVQINYYYYVENKVEWAQPDKQIEGQVFAQQHTNNNISGTCDDTENSYNETGKYTNVVSIPSGTTATVGITGISKYMLGAITTDYISTADSKSNTTADITLNVMVGDQKKTATTEISYKAGYNKVTDMALYKLSNAVVYDSQDNLFGWSKGQKNVTPTNMGLTVELTGINNKKINSKSSSAINDINNYAAVEIVKDGVVVSKNSTAKKAVANIVLLTQEQLNQVDINGDNQVNQADKTYANNNLSSLLRALNVAIAAEKEAKATYDAKVQEEANLKTALDNATTKLNELSVIYDEKYSILTSKSQAISKAEGDLTTLENNLETKNKELEDLLFTKVDKEAELRDANIALESATAEKNRLYDIYMQSITERNTLAANAACTDKVEDEVYIYLEESEKEALEQCRLAKEAYAKNLEDKVVENAQQAYEDYEDNYWQPASSSVAVKQGELNIVLGEIEAKEKQISDLEKEISEKSVLIDIMRRDYQTYYEEEYYTIYVEYSNYARNVYDQAENAYNTYVEEAHVANAKKNLDEAQKYLTDAQKKYDEYKAKVDVLYEKYDEYKALYDQYNKLVEHSKIGALDFARFLDLKLRISVQNMIVNVNKSSLTNLDSKESNMKTATYDLATYINNKTVAEVTAPRPNISASLYSNIGSTQLEVKDFVNSSTIAQSKLNGVRYIEGKVEYEAQVVIGNKSVKAIEDNVYYSKHSNNDQTVIFKIKNDTITKDYKINAAASDNATKYKDVGLINVYTPISVTAAIDANDDKIIDQTTTTRNEAYVIQANTPFTITLGSNVGTQEKVYPELTETNKFSAGYYVKFNFDVHNVSINGKTYNNGDVVTAGTWIGIINKNKNGEAKITVQAYGNIEEGVSESNNKYYVRAVAYNATDIMLNESTKYASIDAMIADESNMKDILNNICDTSSYFAEDEQDVIILNRAYDFKVTDLKDISWKSVFRKTTGSSTNAHKGIVYYAGTRKWNTNSERLNDLPTRSSSEIGRNPLRILPIGPYKNTDTTYIKAPKLGYRFSFDMKVTGSYYDSSNNPNENKYVSIATRFYYISKDGKKYLEESDGTKEGIYLFYKTSDGKYVKIGNNGGEYSLRFTPNDGYRYIEDNNITTLSTKSISLGNLRNLKLTHEMATVSDNNSVITYYGEYKLPNSTIAVKVNDDGSYDINSPLTDGYIGVVFDIVAHAGIANGKEVELHYSQDTSDKPNTSQWDYEGFLGYTKEGEKVDDGMLSLRLEKGKWNITDDIYQDIKGTVILYDIDGRAATDYE